MNVVGVCFNKSSLKMLDAGVDVGVIVVSHLFWYPRFIFQHNCTNVGAPAGVVYTGYPPPRTAFLLRCLPSLLSRSERIPSSLLRVVRRSRFEKCFCFTTSYIPSSDSTVCHRCSMMSYFICLLYLCYCCTRVRSMTTRRHSDYFPDLYHTLKDDISYHVYSDVCVVDTYTSIQNCLYIHVEELRERQSGC